MSMPILLSFLSYIFVMLGIGFYFYRQTNDLNDYVLGGRKLNPGVTALSAGASDMSGWLLLGLPGMIYTEGLIAFWLALGLFIGSYLNWHYVAQPLRISSEKLNNSITIPDYFANRFQGNTTILRVITAVIILLFYTLYTSSGLVGGAKLFEASFDLSYQSALIIGSILIVSYTFLGGYNAVSWTDFIQGILMLLALLVIPAVVLYEMGGITNSIEIIKNAAPNNLMIIGSASIISIISLLSWGLGYFGQPHILVRFMSIERPEHLPTAKTIAMSWMLLSLIGALSVGFFGYAYVLHHEIQLDDAEKIFMVLSQILFNPWIAGFLLAAILAAIMSTIDSQLLVSSSVLTRDIYQTCIRKNATEQELVWMSRITVIVIALIAFTISLDQDASVLQLVSYAWAGFGAAFGPLIILSLYKELSQTSAIVGMLTGSLTVIIWKPLNGGLFNLYELLPGFIFAWLAILVVNKFDKTPTSANLKNA